MEIDNVEGDRELEVEETSTQLCDIQSLQQRAMETLGREEWGKFTVDSHLKHDDVVDIVDYPVWAITAATVDTSTCVTLDVIYSQNSNWTKVKTVL